MTKILVADIGGTNSRFALFDGRSGVLEMEDSIWLETHGATSFSVLLEQLWSSRFKAGPEDFQMAVMAVAGAVSHGVICPCLPNVSWGIDLREGYFGEKKAWLMNDFAAQAYACRTQVIDDAVVIQEGTPCDEGVIGVIGAGTGLGYSALLHGEREWIALSSEAGHMAFPFVGRAEAEYAAFNQRASGRHWPEGDSVVTGLGLQLLHRYLTGMDLSPAEISASLTPEDETTQWYARLYGRACRNWALTVMSDGGFFIAGGIAAKNPMFVQLPDFINEFHNSHVYKSFLHSVPIKLNVNEESGLFGAGFYALQRMGMAASAG